MTTNVAQAAAAEAAQKLIDPWNKACVARDWDAMLSMCTDDVVFMPPGEPQVSGAELRPWLDSFPTIKSLSWSVGHLEATDDLAYLRGPVQMNVEVDGQVQAIDGKYCDIMRRGVDGQWRIALVIWNPNSE